MAILEETVREENEGKTEEEIDEMEEVVEAEQEQALVQEAFGVGLDHQTLMRFDQMAHHIAHAMGPKKVAQAELMVAEQWDPLHHEYRNQFTALHGIESIKGKVIAPVLEHKTQEARHTLEQRAADMMRDNVATEGRSREDIQAEFCGTISKEVCGAEYHPIAVEVFEQMVAPTAQTKQPEPEVQPEQQEKAEEQIQDEEEKQQE